MPHHDAYLMDRGTISFWFYANDINGTQGLVNKDASGRADGGHFGVALAGGRLVAGIESESQDNLAISPANIVERESVVPRGGRVRPARATGLSGWCARRQQYHHRRTHRHPRRAGNTEPWTFGVLQTNSSPGSTDGWSNAFHGRLDDVRLYNQNFNADQADDLYQQTSPRGAIPPIVADVSGNTPALDLNIADPDHVTWLPGGGLTIDAATRLQTVGPATRLHDAITETDQYTLQCQFTPARVNDSNRARIVTYSPDGSTNNFQLGQMDDYYYTRLRTETQTTGNSVIDSPATLTPGQSEHVLVTYDGETIRLYHNGRLEVAEPRTGDLDNWDSGYALTLASEYAGDLPWLGTLHRVAIYDGAINKIQAENLFNGDPPGDGTGGEEGLAYQVQWLESP